VNCLLCNNCYKKFCSPICLNQHNKQIHQKPIDNKEKQEKYNNKEIKDSTYIETQENLNDINFDDYESTLIKKGQYLSEIIDDEDFDIKNFDLKTNQSLGEGSFGDVFVGVNKKDKKKYAIKRVSY